MRTRLTLLPLLVAAVALAGCGGGDDPTVASTRPAPSALSEADVAFLSGMVPHHEQAVEMSEIVLGADPSPEVADLAERIRAAQDPEIEEMEALLAAARDADDGGHGGHGGHGGGSAGVRHGGMMSDAELAELRAAEGVEAERLFLRLMVEHHRGAVEAADEVLASSDGDARVRGLASRIRDTQTAEIAEMERLLARR
jgi:uncharacterized protein (DUF305 family)